MLKKNKKKTKHGCEIKSEEISQKSRGGKKRPDPLHTRWIKFTMTAWPHKWLNSLSTPKIWNRSSTITVVKLLQPDTTFHTTKLNLFSHTAHNTHNEILALPRYKTALFPAMTLFSALPCPKFWLHASFLSPLHIFIFCARGVTAH